MQIILWLKRFKARGKEPATSASPPVLENGAISEEMETIFKFFAIDY